MNVKVGKPVYFSGIGKKDNQEDYLYPKLNDQQRELTLPLFLVCDGVGGQDRGEVASFTVCEAFGNYFNNYTLPTSAEELGSFFANALSYAYGQLDEKDMDYAFGRAKMGTTLTFAFFCDNHCLVAHIGDSRIYLIRPRDKYPIKFKSNDHSLINYLLCAGEITLEESVNHPQKNVILRAMQPHMAERSEAEVHLLDDLHPGDYLFMCTDGVLEKLDEEVLCQILEEETPDQEKMIRIKEICEGSYDNYTAWLIPVCALFEEISGPVNEKVSEEIPENVREHVLYESRPMMTDDEECNILEKPINESETTKTVWWEKLFLFSSQKEKK